MSAHWWWWGMAVALTAFELMSGTLYLLVLAAGAGVGGLVAIAGLGVAAQVLVVAITTLVGWFLLRRFHPRRRGGLPPVQANQDVLLDIGSRVRVDRWQPGGVSRVHYRGAAWEAVIAPGTADEPVPGDFEIRAIEGNRLVLAPLR